MKPILHHFFTNGGILIVFRDGTKRFERTPDHMTGAEHLKAMTA